MIKHSIKHVFKIYSNLGIKWNIQVAVHSWSVFRVPLLTYETVIKAVYHDRDRVLSMFNPERGK